MDTVSCRVKGVYMAVGTAGVSPAVILTLGDDTCLPIYIGLWEAMSIQAALNNEIPPRPLTHDLFVDFLERFNIVLKTLVIDSIDDGVYYANMILEHNHHEMTMDCRPSDGIAISIRCKAGILVTNEVARSSAIPIDELPSLMDIGTYLAG
ncbi:MAG TPA: bifunctional nuclease family protein [Methanoregulaceae archaeon]|nr:MAG: bifunctional nuclease family protein [Methanolinea sp.]HON81273.1 bifunctional nuclease family protein [Methanoregulaceae archaeon]HPD10121.1 bifunctional nuclease family protein [Methanoregulaceae archaeon]HRT15127.1 bifunctional nuclease family protein [Methanoregulaceae archaeon]HRU30756.1 bifunctional nuclease family protein [Methanoregulaceae archaeon]